MRDRREKSTHSKAFGSWEGLLKDQVLHGCHSNVGTTSQFQASHDLCNFPCAKITLIVWPGEGSASSIARADHRKHSVLGEPKGRSQLISQDVFQEPYLELTQLVLRDQVKQATLKPSSL